MAAQCPLSGPAALPEGSSRKFFQKHKVGAVIGRTQ
jgi:hypothetical protein